MGCHRAPVWERFKHEGPLVAVPVYAGGLDLTLAHTVSDQDDDVGRSRAGAQEQHRRKGENGKGPAETPSLHQVFPQKGEMRICDVSSYY